MLGKELYLSNNHHKNGKSQCMGIIIKPFNNDPYHCSLECVGKWNHGNVLNQVMEFQIDKRDFLKTS